MFGFIARNHNEIGKNVYEYIMRDDTPYSFLLANNIFLHRKYYKAYLSYIKQWIKSIDRWQACEDIAMSFMVNDLNGYIPCAFKVRGEIIDIRENITSNGYRGLSKRKGHLFQRSYCLNRFAERYELFPLVRHDNTLSSASFQEFSIYLLILIYCRIFSLY